MSILIAIPSKELVHQLTLKSIYELSLVDNVNVEVFTGYSAAHNRNKAARHAIEKKYTHILYIDSDQIVPPAALRNLYDLDADIAAGWSMMNVGDDRSNVSRFIPNEAFGYYDFLTRSEVDALKGTCSVDAIGFACVLIKTSVFEKLEYPFFRYIEYGNGEVLSEDLYFCDQVRKRGMDILCVPSLKIDHLKMVVI